MKTTAIKIRQLLNLDKLGISLSLICAVHCALTPLVILSLPIMARYYLAHPWFHWLMAVLIVPVGLWAFVSGYKHHQRVLVFFLGVPGLIMIGIIPIFFHARLSVWSEPILMVSGSCLLISAHWLNRKSCACELHGHQHE